MPSRILQPIGVGFALLLAARAPVQAQTCNPAIAESTPTSRFIVDDVNHTVTDIKTGLTWKKCAEGQFGRDCQKESPSTWEWRVAVTIGSYYSFAGYNDWRLPNAKELATLVEVRCASPAINLEVFPNSDVYPNPGFIGYWSSSPVAGTGSQGWWVDFENGHVLHTLPGIVVPLAIRLVRGGT